MNSAGADFPRVRGYGAEGSSRKAKITKGNQIMRNRNIVTRLATGLCVLASFALLPRVQATPDPEDDPPGPDSPANVNRPVMRVQVAPKKAPAAPTTALAGFNTADGDHALFNITTGLANTAVGWYSLFGNTDGSFNTAVGAGTLVLNVGNQAEDEGLENTAVGTAALLFNSTGSRNTAVGSTALENNATGLSNTAVGYQALFNNIDSNSNTAVGRIALINHTTGSFNTAIGNQALELDASGTRNTAVGSAALVANTTGSDNTAVGRHAGDVITGSGNVCIGESVAGEAGVDNRTYIRNVNTDTVSGAGTDSVTVNLTTGRIGHLSSSRRYKEDIKPMDQASEALYRLKPVSYRYKKEIDQSQSLDYGLVAEEVAQVDPNLAIRDGNGQIESVRYLAVNAMLLNEFLKEHQTVQELKTTVAQQKKQIDALTAGLQKVSAQIQVNKPAPQVTANNE
jgi:hypothetical protein